MKRSSFVAMAAMATALPAMPAAAQTELHQRRGRKALVLIGGANRGAYEAGAIQALVEMQQIGDGKPLDFDLVCGTSIGALNGYMVTTAQYAKLMNLWRGEIAGRNVFRLKPEFDALVDSESGLLDRAAAAYRLSGGVVKNVKGVLDPAPVEAVLQRYVDPAMPVHLPFYISTTNLTTKSNVMFELKPTTAEGEAKQAINDALLVSSGEPVRVVDDALVRRVLFASAAIPLLFDPIQIPRESDPSVYDSYVDGGVTQNVPLDIALLCADTLNVILLSPALGNVTEEYASALEIGLGMFETMQERILAYQVRLGYALAQEHLPFTPYVIRPKKPLPGKGSDFNDQAELEAMWQMGYKDMSEGWVSFAPPPNLPLSSDY